MAEQESRLDLSPARKLQQDRAQPISTNLRLGQTQDPATFANTQRISAQTGLSPGIVAQNPTGIENASRLDLTAARELQKRSPVTGAFLTDYKNAVIAQNDVSLMEQIEAVVRGFPAGFLDNAGMAVQGTGRAIGAARRITGQALDTMLPESFDAGLDAIYSDDSIYSVAERALQYAGDNIKRSAEMMRGDEDAQTYASQVSAGLGQMAGQILIAMAGGAAMSAASLYATGVDIQGEKQEATGTEGSGAIADTAVLLGGAVTAVTEIPVLDRLMTPLPDVVKQNIQKRLLDIMAAGGVEAVQEAVEAAAQNALEIVSTNADGKVFEGAKEEAAVAGTVGAIMRALLQAALPGTARTVDTAGNENDKRVSAERTEIDKLNQFAEKSEMRKVDPERFMQFMTENDGNKNTQVYLSTEAVLAYLAGKNVEEDMGLLALAVAAADAEITGTAVAVPLPDFVTHIAGTPHFAALRDSMALNPNTVGTIEQKAEFDRKKDELKKLMEFASGDMTQFVEARELYETVKAQLIDTGVVTPQNAAVMAEIVPAFAMRYAQTYGLSIADVFAKFTVEGPQTGRMAELTGEELAQEASKFAAWFNESKVINADGTPTVVYHGTTADIDSFQMPAYFTEDSREGSAYTFSATLARREKILNKRKYRAELGAEQYAGQRVPYVGIISDAEVGVIYATDEGVARRNEDGTVTVFTDLVAVDDSFKFGEPMTIELQTGDARETFDTLQNDLQEFVDRRYPPGEGEGGNVVPVYLSIKNPKEMHQYEANRFASRLGGTKEQWEAAVAELEAEGYDGIVTISDDPGFAIESIDPPRQWIPLRPEQIKSAVGNNGQFNPNDSNILRQPISTRVPTAKRGTIEDHLLEHLSIGVEAIEADPKLMSKILETISGYANYSPPKGTRGEKNKLEAFIDHATANLIWLYEQVDPETRERSKLWYDGANAIANRFSERYGLDVDQVAGVMAALSPQKDWFMNVSLAERVMDTFLNRADTAWSPEMDETANRIFGKEQYELMLADIRGKTLLEIDDTLLQAMWVRIYDEAHNDRNFRAVTPEGDFSEYVTTGKGNRTKLAWGSLNEVAKAVGVIKDGSIENISSLMGGNHKVRNFYNNITDPNGDNGSVTIDTHAVAAALLQPLSGASAEVMHNFGGPSSAATGSVGTYGVYAEAYRRAAAQVGLLPREMQSITWEAVRSLFPAGYKSQAKNTDHIQSLWKQFKKGDITLEEIRNAITEHAGGVGTPSWYGLRAGRNEEISDSSYQTELPEPRVPGGDSRVVSGTRSRSAAGASADVLNQDARGYYDPKNSVVRLTNAADASTFMHEFAHFMFEMELQQDGPMAQSINAWFKRNAADVAAEANGYLAKPAESDVLEQEGYDVLAPEKRLRPFQPALDAARRIAERLGMTHREQQDFAPLNINRGRRIAKMFDRMSHSPNDPRVKAAYDAMVNETIVQYQEVLATGIELHFIRETDPYGDNPRKVIEDVVKNNRMYVYPTRSGFGSDQTFDPKDNPLLAETEYEIDGEKILVNDMFRVVHDYFGHIKAGVGFRAEGEENAWQSHALMYSPLARRAMTTETRGQNSWVNFGPYGDKNRRALAKDTVFADQKINLLPMWVSEEGHTNDGQADDTTGRDERGNLVTPPVQDGRITLTHFSNSPGIDVIDPEFYGTGYAGAEKARTGKRNWLNRSFYGIAVGEPGGYRRERGIGANQYTTTIDANQLYDAAADPDGLREGLKGKPGTPQRLNEYEAAIHNAGYSGYWTNDSMMMAVVFDALPVEQAQDVNGEITDFRQELNSVPGSGEGPITAADVNLYIDNKTTGDAAKDNAIRRATHEQFARGFEQYVMEGRAPSVELRGVFRKLAAWITDVYKRLQKFMAVNLDDEMREVFDRLIATDDQIARAMALGRAQPMFRTAEEAGMTPAQWQEYSERTADVPNKAKETLRGAVMKELTRQATDAWKAELADVIVEETARLQGDPAYRAINALKNGDLKLDHADVKQRTGRTVINKAGIQSVRIPPQLNGMTKTGAEGLLVDDAAPLLGFSSGDELLYTLMNTQPIKEAAAAAAEAVMIERHGDILNDGTIEQKAAEAVQNEERGKLMLAELRAIRKNLKNQTSTFDIATVKAAAKEAIAAMSFSKIHPGKYRAAEVRFARESADAHAKGDFEGAAFAKSQQILNHYYAIEATNARDEITGVVEFMGRYNKKSVREEIMKAEGGFWEQITKILTRFEFRKGASQSQVNAQNIQALEAWMNERMEVEGDNLVISAEVLDEMFRTHWRNVPLDVLRGVQNSVKNIEHVARYGNKISRLGEEVNFKKLVADAVASMNDKVKTVFTPQRTTVAEGRKFIPWATAQMTKIPFLTSWLDGGERVGLMHQIVMQPMTDALHAEQELWKTVGADVMKAIESRSKADMKRHNTKIFIPEIKDEKNDGNLMGHQVIAVALNVGNESNLRKLLLGEGWANVEDDTTITMDNPKLQAVLKHMTPADWELVQTIWDKIDLLYPLLAEVTRKTSGLTPPKVEARSFKIGDIEVRGGYYPVKYDAKRSGQAAYHEERKAANVDSMFSAQGSMNASVNAGAVNERTKYFAPIRLSLDVVPNHIQETIHYITHHDAVREVNKFLRNPEVRDTIIAKMGEHEYNQLKSWLNDVAKDGREAPNKTFVDDVMSRLRFGITLGAMGFKASTGIMQIAGLSNIAAEVGVGNMAQAMKSIFFSEQSIRDSWEFAKANSKVLANRTRTMDRELRSAIERIEASGTGVSDGTTYGAVRQKVTQATKFMKPIQEASMKHIMFIQTYGVDLPTWYAAYIKELGISGDEVKAAQYGDWAVENLQGSGSTKDMAGMLRNQTGVHRMFTMFMTYFSAMWNLERDTVRGAVSGQYSVTTTAAKAMFLIALPVIFESLVRGDIEAPEDDEDPSIWQQLLLKISLYPVMSIPLLRDAASATTGEFGYTMSPVAGVLEKGIESSVEITKRAFTDEEITKAQVKNSSKLAGAALAVPGVNQAWSTGEHLYQVLEEGEEITARELLFGPKPE